MNQSDPSQSDGTTKVVALLPRDDDPTRQIASGDHPHVTLFHLGDGETNMEKLKSLVENTASLGYTFPDPFDMIAGEGTLGVEGAHVYFLDARFSEKVHSQMEVDPWFQSEINKAEQFPTWTPHITIGYPDAPAEKVSERPDGIVYDRLAIFDRGEVIEYPIDFTDADDQSEAPEEESVVASGDIQDEELSAAVEELQQNEGDWEVPIKGTLAPEGTPSSDGRMFSKGALLARDLPIPLRWVERDSGGHDNAVIVGRIDDIFRDGNEVKFQGVMDTSAAAYESVRLIANGMLRGISVDVSDVVMAEGEEGDITEFSSAKIAAATLVAIPAFSEAFVQLGTWDEKEEEGDKEFADRLNPRHMDGPGWITDPKPTTRITNYWVDGRGAAKIRWGQPNDFHRCRRQLAKYVKNPDWLSGLCANLHHRALGIWPGQHSLESSVIASASPSVTFAPSVEDGKLSAEWFKDPALKMPTPLTVTNEGRVFGHLASWDACHIGYSDQCVTAPRSVTDYAYFRTGEVETTEGPLAVGQIVMGGPHANPRAQMQAAFVHYASTSSALADVNVGEDEYGIWVAGALRDGISPENLRALKASGLSGDWRRVRANGQANLELMAALAVNVQGFPIPRASLAASGEKQLSLTAAAPVVSPSKVDNRSRLAEARNALRAHRASMLKSELGF